MGSAMLPIEGHTPVPLHAKAHYDGFPISLPGLPGTL